MNNERRAIFQLLALGRINAAQAERLLAALSADREALWAIAGCVLIVAVTQINPIAAALVHLVRTALSSSLPLQHALSTLAAISLSALAALSHSAVATLFLSGVASLIGGLS
jgi:hypothetical protein